MEAALSTIGELAHGRRRVVVLGEMRELGDLSAAAHRRIGAAAVQAGAALLMACGEMGQLYIDAAVEAGLANSDTAWAPDSAALALLVGPRIAPHDLVLIKGSRGARMERVVDALVGAAESSVPKSE
jgi:UDP-N-acetylmuramyl pentapeptide synthase